MSASLLCDFAFLLSLFLHQPLHLCLLFVSLLTLVLCFFFFFVSTWASLSSLWVFFLSDVILPVSVFVSLSLLLSFCLVYDSLLFFLSLTLCSYTFLFLYICICLSMSVLFFFLSNFSFRLFYFLSVFLSISFSSFPFFFLSLFLSVYFLLSCLTNHFQSNSHDGFTLGHDFSQGSSLFFSSLFSSIPSFFSLFVSFLHSFFPFLSDSVFLSN